MKKHFFSIQTGIFCLSQFSGQSPQIITKVPNLLLQSLRNTHLFIQSYLKIDCSLLTVVSEIVISQWTFRPTEKTRLTEKSTTCMALDKQSIQDSSIIYELLSGMMIESKQYKVQVSLQLIRFSSIPLLHSSHAISSQKYEKTPLSY